ncbi:LysR substrate-binding domain-containing protein [Pseudomonas syringae]|uniref:LysR substrate-binding domain-containing protein n=7 Tax=Pseudomonas syringae TaxID=317 RepID=UPI000CD10EF7|nr:LysR substrate-binding domain-containing protein [Pseudomonas syringae]MCF4984185.1 LysR family transcriptional regulator [Pseudomonas syringae]MCF5202837.1 LysR family transcriptional regulator [Pseudomonas syringae]MCF5209431.1 LysR family transcriptional regulator [Pseudomonas syringae]MCF5212506.1 LysR family transcriptional regulator [Pseudomonas syringae]MCF5220863.1 LysR family transcriptional regulator [Pseudomonas syringae]
MFNLLQLDLVSLRLLVLAAKSENLTQAAQGAHMTVSAASKRLAELERVTHCTLFNRVARGLQLTPAGRGLAEHARTMLEVAEQMAHDANDYANGVRGHVRLFANTSAVIQFLPQDLASFLAANPHVRIELEEALSDRTIGAVESGQAEIGIFADNAPAPQLHTRPYRRDRLVVLVPQAHPLAQRACVSLADTLDFDYVALNQGSSLLRRISAAAVGTGKSLKVRIQVSSFDGICRMIEAGLGIGILPLGSVHPELLVSKLRAIPLEGDWALRTLYVGVADVARLSPEAANLFSYLSSLEPTPTD